MSDIYTIPLPPAVRDRVAGNTHPGLLLDKYSRSWSDSIPPEKLSAAVQKPTIQEIVRLSQQAPAGLAFGDLLKQRQFTLDQIHAVTIKALTAGPLTLHLSRASSLENAGICLHRIYGFTYLPGTGIKGMVRAFAETVWLPSQPNRAEAWCQIEDVFGWAPNPERLQAIEKNEIATRYRDAAPQKDVNNQPIKQHERAGRVVFHDAWPLAWPKLESDILTSHHQTYYGGKDVNAAPGDWDEPIPVYFLAVESGTPFEFAISPSRAEDTELVGLARLWLIGALENQGAGAKTNAGYGNFKVELSDDSIRNDVRANWMSAESQGVRRERSFTLTLASPAFLAGADAEDRSTCDLRVPTLRGQLRWWWRTLHAGHLGPVELRRLESAIWGDTKRSGAVRIRLTRSPDAAALNPLSFDREGIKSANDLPDPKKPKTTLGLTYATYGMDELKDGKRLRRYYLEPGTSWIVTMTIRPGKYIIQEAQTSHPKKDEISKRLTLDRLAQEAVGALELLCRMGGVGSKSRKGFGNFVLPGELSGEPLAEVIPRLMEQAKSLRSELGLKEGKTGSPALDQLILVQDVVTPWVNYWVVLDRLGDSAQDFAQSKKHHLEKKALGLPRNVRPPYIGSFRAGREIRDRHASPIHYHVAPGADGRFVAQMIAFPADQLPTLAQSKQFLTNALAQIRVHFVKRTQEFSNLGQSQAVTAKNSPSSTKGGPKQATSRIFLPPITQIDIKNRVEELQQGLRQVFEVQQALSDDRVAARRFKVAKIKSGYQPEGNWVVTGVPFGFPGGGFIVADMIPDSKQARFVEAFGQLPPPAAPQKNPNRR